MAYDEEFKGTLGGATTGAMTGAAVGSVIPGVGTGIGAAVGGGLGGISGFFRGRANKAKKKGANQAIRQMAELKRQQYAQRQADLAKAMSFFGPADAALAKLYGTPEGEEF